MDTIKPRKIRKQDFKSARAVTYSEKEAQRIISEKVRERIKIQENLREMFLERRVREERIDFFKTKITAAIEENAETITFSNIEMSKAWAMAEYNKELFNLKKVLFQENYFKQALKNVGFSDEDILRVLDGEYIKDDKELLRRENELEAKKE